MTPQDAVLHLLAVRGAGKTICPSEAARLLAGDQGDWRGRMDDVHAAAQSLLDTGKVRLSWKGQSRLTVQGPYRIALA
ncbi:MAG: DUF3253 domain-containing protein [Alteraurantiacibacter sp.]